MTDVTAGIAMRVTPKGHGIIHTGEFDERAMRARKFAQGDVFDCPPANVPIYEARGIAIRVMEPGAPKGVTAPAASHGHPIDQDAIARLHARARRDPETGCLVWLGSKVNGGYGQITYRRMLHRTHRLAYVAHRGPVPQGLYVCHVCDNPACIAIEHLFLGTPQENYRDMRAKGRSRYNAKLETADVAEIKARLARGEKASEIAKRYAVRYGQILNIKHGLAWREVAPACSTPVCGGETPS